MALFHRRAHRPRSRRYPSDTTDAQWALIDPLLPGPVWLSGNGGRREVHCRREIVDAIFYVVDNGITWRALPADSPPWSTVYNYVAARKKAGAAVAMLDVLRDRTRPREGHMTTPSAGIIDSPSVKAAENVGQSSRGYDARKKTNGRQRHIVTDTLGLLLRVIVTTASVQDRDAGRVLLQRLAPSCRRIRLVWADGGYAGKLVTCATISLKVPVEIVKAPTRRQDSTSCRHARSSNTPSPGSPAIAAASVTTNVYPNTMKPSSARAQSPYSPDTSHHRFRNRL
ncbi:IS5 family transposase [Haloechinothrix sp. LS1_15]|uniref:IS5 family transposase n=1 Tax=Haloechinothrix sp. LS1_15 TaxID=2652248 RepID=UPI00294AD01E|nr:IS5 family transposase [Haloechinothrix sp. LS1_15]